MEFPVIQHLGDIPSGILGEASLGLDCPVSGTALGTKATGSHHAHTTQLGAPL